MIEELRVPDLDTRNEVVAVYEELLTKLKDNKKSHPQEEVAHEEKKRHIEKIAKTKPEECEKSFEQLRRHLNDALDQLKDKYLTEQKKLAEIVQHIELKTRELHDLHQIEVNVDSLTALLFAQKNKSAAFEKEMKEWRQNFEQEVTQKRREWQQEEQKYVYQRDISREKDRTYAETAKRNLEQELTAMREQYQKQIEDREARLVAGEHELKRFEELNEKIAQFPQQLREAVRQAEEAVTKQLTSKFDYEAQLYQKEVKIHEQTIETLETKITMLEGKLAHFESLKNSLNRLTFGSMDAIERE